MKLQYKAAGLMILVGVIILFFITIVFTNLIKKTVLQEELQNISNISKEIAHHMNSHLESNSDITKSFSSAPIIKDALIQSNTIAPFWKWFWAIPAIIYGLFILVKNLN